MIGKLSLGVTSWGDIPTWVSSFVALMALAFAAVAAVAARRTFLIESERDRVNALALRTQEAFLRRSQAALISAWWGQAGHGPSTDPAAWGAFTRNASEAPVYQAFVTIVDQAGAPIAKISLPVMAPAASEVFHTIAWHEQEPIQAPRRSRCRVQVTFTDATGVRWMRDQYGLLTELAPDLKMWGGDDLETVLTALGEDFQASYGVAISYKHEHAYEPTDWYEQVVIAAETGQIADVVECPHDWIGGLVHRGIIDPVVMASDHLDAFEPLALEALTYHGRLYGVPLNIHCPVLIRNLNLVPEAPSSIDEMVARGTALVAEGRARLALSVQVGEHGDPFHLSPIYTAAGGELFGRLPDGAWNPADIRVASATSLAAWRKISELGEKGLGVLRSEVDRHSDGDLFLSGQAPFLIAMFRSMQYARRAGVRCELSRVPPFAEGPPPQPFVLVNGFCITRRGRNRIIAHGMLPDYFSRPDVTRAQWEDPSGWSGSHTTSTTDPDVLAYKDACRNGVIMPSAPGMIVVWRLFGQAQANVIRGADPILTAKTLAADLTRLHIEHGRNGPRRQATGRPV
ncbi:sugar ABC transporter substrate-binding protein [Micromonospora chersina]|uniref:sugar ABC transporter substrate-binding protein n=1 Tax=Micromonospora chersina TaxID=47854 RepID=UPI0037159F61